MKRIILEIDENKNAQVLKADSMEHMECINLLLAAAASINEVTRELGAGLIKSIDKIRRRQTLTGKQEQNNTTHRKEKQHESY